MSLLQMYKWTLAGMCCLVTPLCIPSWRSVYGCCKHIEKFAQVSCWALFSLVHKSWYSLPGSLIPKLHPRPVATLMAEGYFVLFFKGCLNHEENYLQGIYWKGMTQPISPKAVFCFWQHLAAEFLLHCGVVQDTEKWPYSGWFVGLKLRELN